MTAPVSGKGADVTSVSEKEGRGKRRGPLTLDDCRCPVCLEIFLEPVTLPCTHTFCKGCFLETVDKTTLCCPMCRKRVSTWARLNSKNNTLVNQQLWRQIQTCFPTQCERRLAGQDDEDDSGVSGCFPIVSQPGELRQEYEDQIIKLTEERRVLDEEEMKSSEEYIQRLLAEEEELMQEERRRREEDERLAILLSNQLVGNSAEATPAKKKEAGPGQIEKFLCPLPSKTNSCCSPTSRFIANKENILSQREHPDRHLDSVEEQAPRSQVVGNGGPSSTFTKRKSCVQETTEEEVVVTKRGCHSLPSSSSSLEEAVLSLQRRSEWETELSRRQQQQQEEEDRQFALLLQKELNEEEKKRATNRQKGSADAYLLRQNRVGKAETSSKTPSRQSRRTTKTSSASSSSPSLKPSQTPSSSSSRGSKQITLTEMFTSLSS
ncbi:hypothetical protein INR49_018562 [Caranx melampygus]|nr:hypothetical protein INR49_018562 [Caranx melampygus]